MVERLLRKPLLTCEHEFAIAKVTLAIAFLCGRPAPGAVTLECGDLSPLWPCAA